MPSPSSTTPEADPSSEPDDPSAFSHPNLGQQEIMWSGGCGLEALLLLLLFAMAMKVLGE